MALTTLQLLALSKLPKIGYKKVTQLGSDAFDRGVELFSDTDIIEYLHECIDRKVITGVKPDYLDITIVRKAVQTASKILDDSDSMGIGVVNRWDASFPLNLKAIKPNKGENGCPYLMYYKGNISCIENKPAIAVIGTREPTPEGIRAGEFFSEYFAKAGFNIVSGLAIGCDASAHRGALMANGTTTAFLAHGLDYMYPKENESLASQIVEAGGLLMSEYHIGTPPFSAYFVERDRLQSGLADATLVIQTGIKGGTMHATRATLINGKPLYAVRYKDARLVNHEKVCGNMMLIEKGLQEGKAEFLTTDNLSLVTESLKSHFVSCKQKDITDNQVELKVKGEQLSLF
jgi:DNA processing protein